MRGKVSCKLSMFFLATAAALAGCGGGGGPDTEVTSAPAPAPSTAPAPVAAGPAPVAPPSPAPTAGAPTQDLFAQCSALAAHPARPASARSVSEFGVRGDGSDETDAMQRALDALQPGQWLVFPAGRYVHSKTLQVKVKGAVLWSDGATLHASNPEDQAVQLMADGASIYNFTLTAVTGRRLTAPWQSRIAVFAGTSPRVLLKDNVVRGNRIIHAGAAGTPLANSASAAGIFVFHATRFLVAENTVARSLADAIHITAGSFDGRVLKNTVREPGDDMIAVVSYIGAPTTSAAEVAASIDRKREVDLVRDVLVANNDVSGQYWGRGITVVGGENVTIQANRINRTTHGAAIYLARETAYLTFGVRNVLVRDNDISQVQTTAPAYLPPEGRVVQTGHSAVELYSWIFTDEASHAGLGGKLAVQNVQIEGNRIDGTKFDALRIGNGFGRTWGESGRTATGGQVGFINVVRNSLSNVGGTPVSVRNSPPASFNVRCEANTADGQPTSAAQCNGPAPVVTGAQVTCG